MTFVKFAVLLCSMLSTVAVVAQPSHPGLRIAGRHLLTPCGDTLMLRGVNKMVIWTGDLDLRKATYAEIKKTGANCVRIVWLAQPGQFEADATPAGLDRNIQDAIDAGLIPMVELHDATGDWSRLTICVDYWTRPDVVEVVKKHERYMLLNIANEAGNETVTDQQFTMGYTTAIQRIREAGIKTPLIIDAADWGKNLEQLVRTGATLQSADPMRNVMYSAHLYWATSDGANDAFITQQFNSAVDAGLPFIIGEFTHLFNRGGGCTYETDYQTIIRRCQELRIGWLAWEWGPGNEFADPTCVVMNMTTDSKYATLKDGWGRDVAETSTYSIRSTSVSPYFVMHKGACTAVSVQDLTEREQTAFIAPNPSNGRPQLTYHLMHADHVRIIVVNELGATVASIDQGVMPVGQYDVALPITVSGIYYCKLITSTRATTTPFIVIE